jgi:lipase
MIRVFQEARGRVPGDGVELAFGYWPGRGAPVVALHGITANFLGFIGVAERLAGRRPLFALDFRGRGDSDKPPASYGMAQHARDVAAAMRALGLGPSLVVGHSMGGFVATAVAAQNPELVSGLLLIDGGLAIKPSGDTAANESVRAALAERINQLTRTYDSREAYRAFWKTQPNFPPEAWGPWLEAFLDYEVGGEASVQPKALQAAVIADLMEGVNTDEILNRSRAVRTPVTLLRAEMGFTPAQPPLYPDAIMEEIRTYTPALQDRKIEGTTHYTILLGDRGASAIADLIAEDHSSDKTSSEGAT